MQRLSRMERRVRGEQGQGVSQGGTKKRTRDTAEVTPAPSQPPVKKKKVEDNISWSLDRFKQSEDVGSREDELMDEIMADSEHSGLMSRPDTPASVASNDTVKSDQTKKGLKKQKKKSLETKRKSLPVSSVKVENTTERESRNKKLKTSGDSVRFLETPSLYYVGCKNEVLPNPEDKLDEVGVLQRGVEVPSFREDKHYYDLILPNKVKMNFKKEKEVRASLVPLVSDFQIKLNFSRLPGESRAPTRCTHKTPAAPQRISQTKTSSRDTTSLRRRKNRERGNNTLNTSAGTGEIYSMFCRWDLQRLREEQQLQRLRARQEKQIIAVNQLKKEELPSILPNLEVSNEMT